MASKKHKKRPATPTPAPTTAPVPAPTPQAAGSAKPLRGGLGLSVLWVSRVLLLAAAGISSYLAWVSLGGTAVPGCGPESGCHEVLNSRWAYWFGLPVSLPALFLDLALLAASFGLGPDKPAALQRKLWRFIVPGAWLILSAAAWFVSLQLIVLKAFCPFCMGAHAWAGAAAVVLLLAAPYRPAPDNPKDLEREVFLTQSLAGRLFFLGLIGFFVLLTGQLAYQRPTYQITAIPSGAISRPKVLDLFGGKFTLNLEEVPLWGNPAAPHTILALFDYTCHYCRDLHPNLMAAQRHLSNDVAVVHLPMPLDEKCNPAIRPGGTPTEHQEACAYARIGLAVWRADRKRMHEFDDWVFRDPKPPPAKEAEAHARGLVGSAAFDAALNDPWVERQLTNNIAIYLTSKSDYNVGNMPQLVIGTNLFYGNFTSDQLVTMIKTRLGLDSPLLPNPENLLRSRAQ